MELSLRRKHREASDASGAEAMVVSLARNARWFSFIRPAARVKQNFVAFENSVDSARDQSSRRPLAWSDDGSRVAPMMIK